MSGDNASALAVDISRVQMAIACMHIPTWRTSKVSLDFCSKGSMHVLAPVARLDDRGLGSAWFRA